MMVRWYDVDRPGKRPAILAEDVARQTPPVLTLLKESHEQVMALILKHSAEVPFTKRRYAWTGLLLPQAMLGLAPGFLLTRAAYSEMETAALTNRTEFEAAIRVGSTDRARRLAEDLGNVLYEQFGRLVSGAQTYLEALSSVPD